MCEKSIGEASLAISGIASDATEREVHVLFSGCAGYMHCFLAAVGVAIVEFQTVEMAKLAAATREGTTWADGEPSVRIFVEEQTELNTCPVDMSVTRTSDIEIPDGLPPDENCPQRSARVSPGRAISEDRSQSAARLDVDLEPSSIQPVLAKVGWEELVVDHTVGNVGFSICQVPDGRICVSEVGARSWSEKVGLKAGDELVRVDGLSATDTPVEALGEIIRTLRPLAMLLRKAAGPVPACHARRMHSRSSKQNSAALRDMPDEISPMSQQTHPHLAQPCIGQVGWQPVRGWPSEHGSMENLQEGLADEPQHPSQLLPPGFAKAKLRGRPNTPPTYRSKSARAVDRQTHVMPIDAESFQGQPSPTGSDSGSTYGRSQRSARQVRDVTPRCVRTVSNAQATSALLTLRAAVASRKVADLTRAIDEFVALGLDAEATGLNFDQMEAQRELQDARRILAAIDKKAVSLRATTSETRARGRLKKVQDLVISDEVPLGNKVSAMIKAESATQDAVEACRAANLFDTEERLQRLVVVAKETWRNAAKVRISRCAEEAKQTEDTTGLQAALSEADCAGLSADGAAESGHSVRSEAQMAIAIVEQKRSARAGLQEAVRVQNIPVLRRALDEAIALGSAIPRELMADAERLLQIATFKVEGRWTLLAAKLAVDPASDGEETDCFIDAADSAQKIIRALHLAREMGLCQADLEPTWRLLADIHPGEHFWKSFHISESMHRLCKNDGAENDSFEQSVLEAKRILAQTKAHEDVEIAISKRDLELLRLAIEEARRVNGDKALIERALSTLAEEEMIEAMDEAFDKGDADTLERAITAWKAQGLSEEDLETAEGMLEELKSDAASVAAKLLDTIKMPITFEPESNRLSSGGRVVVNDVAAILKKHPTAIIEIHAHYPHVKAEVANETSLCRAVCVKTALQVAGCPNEVHAVGWGQTHPSVRKKCIMIFPRHARPDAYS